MIDIRKMEIDDIDEVVDLIETHDDDDSEESEKVDRLMAQMCSRLGNSEVSHQRQRFLVSPLALKTASLSLPPESMLCP